MSETIKNSVKPKSVNVVDALSFSPLRDNQGLEETERRLREELHQGAKFEL